MKETFYLGSQYQKERLKACVDSLPNKATIKAVITDAKTKSASQLGLQWLWYTEIAISGVGAYDTKEDVHRFCKWKFAVPILLRDDDVFAYIWPEIKRKYQDNKEAMKYIIDAFVSTQGEGFAMGEYLTEIERYYRPQGVNLTDPDRSLLEYVENMA
jgi:hypothetical protein